MRICRVTVGYPPRQCGWSHHTYHLSRNQASRGHRVVVFQPQDNSPYPTDEVAALEVRRIDLGPLSRSWGSGLGRVVFSWLSSREIRRLQECEGFDVIHGHGDIFEALALSHVARAAKIPLVITVHSRLSRHSRYRALARAVWRRVDRVIAVSRNIVSDLAGLGYPQGQVEVVSSGVDTSCFVPVTPAGKAEAVRSLGIDPSTFVVVSVGRLHPMKGFEYLISAIGRIDPAQRLVLYILGDGDQRGRLERLCAGDRRISMLGNVPHASVLQWLTAADVFVLPSIDLPGQAEGTPTAVLEAMAVGLPVLTTDCGGAAEVVAGGPGCTVVPQRDSDALAASIWNLLRDPNLRRQLGAENRQLARDRDWVKIAERVEEAYERAGAPSPERRRWAS